MRKDEEKKKQQQQKEEEEPRIGHTIAKGLDEQLQNANANDAAAGLKVGQDGKAAWERKDMWGRRRRETIE